jgi:hypothetical protein
MSLTILIRGQLSSIPVLSDDCYTKQNYGANAGGNTTLSVNTPRGVLGGSVAGISAGLDYTVVPCTDELRPVGLFVNDAARAAFENSPAVASGKIAVMKAQASVEVDVYETRDAANAADLTYAVGNYLYCSAQGLLTNEVSTEATIIGVLTKAPSTVSPTIGLDERI